MATTGQVNTNTTYDSFFWVYWSQVSQDVANNKTTIYWSCGVTCGHDFKLNAIKMSEVYINGSLVYDGGTYSNLSNGEHRLAYGYLDITHDADGTKTFNISSFTGWLYSNHNYSQVATEHTLDTIPRKATITEASNFTDQQNPSITISNPGGFTMDVWLEPNPIGDHLCVREGITLDANGRYTWTLTDAEREALRNKCPGNACTIRLGLYSYVGGTQYADYKDKTFTMVESAATKPAASLVTSPDNSSLPSKFNSLYIQGKSKVSIRVSGSGKYGATINRCYAAMEGKTYSASSTSDVIQGSGTVRITGYARDSRGFTGPATTDINVIPYSKPVVAPIDGKKDVLCYRGSDGIKDNTCESVYVAAKMVYSSVGGKNSCKMEWRRKKASEKWPGDEVGWKTLIGDNESTTAFANILQVQEDEGFKLDTAYTIQIRAKDALGEEGKSTFDIPTRDVALHLGAGGKKVSVGSYCVNEDYTFHSAWKAIFDEEVVIGGLPVVDHVVEKGTVGIWKYEKMASGIARCWAKIDYSIELESENVRAYVSHYTPFPITFTDVPFCSLTLSNQTIWNHVLASCDFTISHFSGFCVYRMSAGATVTAGGAANIMAIGYWK